MDRNVQIKQNVNRQVQSDDSRTNFEDVRRRDIGRRIKTEVSAGRPSEQRDMNAGDAYDNFLNSIFKENILFIFVLGLTLSLINDFFDIIFWQNSILIGQVLDIVNFILFLLFLAIFGEIHFFSVGLMCAVFILEIVPVLGVLPFWTIGVATWYGVNRRSSEENEQ